MKIRAIEAKKLKLELQQPIVIAIGTIDYCETVLVKIETDEGIVGYGEGIGVPFVTGESVDMILHAIKLLSAELIGLNPFAIELVHRKMDRALVNNASAKAAIDIALYDIMSKFSQVPLHQLLGGTISQIETDRTIGIGTPDAMAQEAVSYVQQGFRFIKVKAGLNPDDDIEVIKQIRERIGGAIHLKVDANQGWSVGDALRVMKSMAQYGVDIVEQPLPYWDLDGLSYLRSRSSVKIMADESCFTPQDAMKLVKKDAVDLINIKLMKCGGLYKALQINAIAEANGNQCMIGCMMESRIGISAAAALVAARSNIVYGDLDSFLYLKEDGRIQGGITSEGPLITLSERYGLGIEVEF